MATRRVQIHGIELHIEARGSGPPLVLLHGFTGSSRSWVSLTDSLANRCHIIAIDVIGHGASAAPRDGARYDYMAVLDDLAGAMSMLGIGQAAWLGYSMGGRLALGMALRHPERVASLILESASPGIADAEERSRRQHADTTLASRIEQDGVPAFVTEWERLPMWQSQNRLPAEIRERQRNIRLGNRAAGLAGSLRGMGAGAQPPLWHDLHEQLAPALLIAGAVDSKFTQIGQHMTEAMPSAEMVVVPDAGHAVHLECPDDYARIVGRFLENQGIY